MTGIILKEIANLSVDCVKEFRGEYSDEVLAIFALIGKYMTIASLPKEERSDISMVTIAERCPLCQFFIDIECDGCPLRSIEMGKGCGHIYDGLKAAASEGTFMDTAFNLLKIVKRLWEDEDDKDRHVDKPVDMDISDSGPGKG